MQRSEATAMIGIWRWSAVTVRSISRVSRPTRYHVPVPYCCCLPTGKLWLMVLYCEPGFVACAFLPANSFMNIYTSVGPSGKIKGAATGFYSARQQTTPLASSRQAIKTWFICNDEKAISTNSGITLSGQKHLGPVAPTPLKWVLS